MGIILNDRKEQGRSTSFLPRNDRLTLLDQVITLTRSFLGLRWFGLPSVVNGSGNLIDLSGNGLTLTNNNTAQYGRYGFAPIATTNGTNQYFSHPDNAAFDITGGESYIATPGLTMGMWARFRSLGPAVQSGGIGKDDVASQRSYTLSPTEFRMLFLVFNGASIYFVSSPNGSISENTWHCIISRFTPSAELKIWIDDASTVNTISIPATINNTTAPFEIGRDGSGGTPRYTSMDWTLGFVAASAVPDHLIEMWYQRSAVLFAT